VAPTVLIAGAGIGGLSAALALRTAGWRVRVFEQAASPRELGFGLALAPNAVAALRDLGVADAVLARSWAPRSGEFRRLDGTVLKRAELPAEAAGRMLVVALRPALHGALLDAVGPDTITVDSAVTGYGVHRERVTVHLANGTTADGEVLIGADGIGSTIRRTLHPNESAPRRAGIVAVRGVVHGAIEHMGGVCGIYYMGRGVEAFLIRASDTGIYWALSMSERLLPASMRDPAAILAHMSPHFDGTWRAVTSASTDMRCDDLVDRDPVTPWGVGRVTLLGDAAHPVLPHTGQGAAQAMMDAVALGQRLRPGVDPALALRAYEHERQGKTAALLGQGRRTARIMGTTSPVACGIREAIVRLIPTALFIKPFVRFYLRINRRAGTDVT